MVKPFALCVYAAEKVFSCTLILSSGLKAQNISASTRRDYKYVYIYWCSNKKTLAVLISFKLRTAVSFFRSKRGFSLLLTARRVCWQGRVPLQNAALAKHRLSGWTFPDLRRLMLLYDCTMLYKTEISIVTTTCFRFLREVVCGPVLDRKKTSSGPCGANAFMSHGFRTVWALNDRFEKSSQFQKSRLSCWKVVLKKSPKQRNILRLLFDRTCHMKLNYLYNLNQGVVFVLLNDTQSIWYHIIFFITCFLIVATVFSFQEKVMSFFLHN